MPVFVKRGFESADPAQLIVPAADGSLRVWMPEVSRLVLSLDEAGLNESENLSGRSTGHGRDPLYEAYELVCGELRPLPIGASFNPVTGVFYWQPGPGFIGEYTIVFIKSGDAGSTKRTVKIVVGAPAAR